MRTEVWDEAMTARADANPWHFKPPGGESYHDASTRMLKFVEELILPLWDGVRCCHNVLHAHTSGRSQTSACW